MNRTVSYFYKYSCITINLPKAFICLTRQVTAGARWRILDYRKSEVTKTKAAQTSFRTIIRQKHKTTVLAPFTTHCLWISFLKFQFPCRIDFKIIVFWYLVSADCSNGFDLGAVTSIGWCLWCAGRKCRPKRGLEVNRLEICNPKQSVTIDIVFSISTQNEA